MADNMATQVEQLIAQVHRLNEQTSSKPSLVYFDIIGIAWPIRCLLHMKEIDYDLIQISIQQWSYIDSSGQQPLKVIFRNGHLPLYVDDEVNLNQSNLILMYLGEKYGVMGDNQTEKFAAMEVMAHAYDALFHFSGLLQTNIKLGITDEVFDTRLEAFMGNGSWGALSNGYQNNLDAFERYLDANTADSGYMVGTRMGIADLHAFNILCNWFKAFDPARFVEQYPRLDEYIQRIADNPCIAHYIREVQEPTIWFQLPAVAQRLTTPEDLEGLVELGE